MHGKRSDPFTRSQVPCSEQARDGGTAIRRNILRRVRAGTPPALQGPQLATGARVLGPADLWESRRRIRNCILRRTFWSRFIRTTTHDTTTTAPTRPSAHPTTGARGNRRSANQLLHDSCASAPVASEAGMPGRSEPELSGAGSASRSRPRACATSSSGRSPARARAVSPRPRGVRAASLRACWPAGSCPPAPSSREHSTRSAPTAAAPCPPCRRS